MKKIRWVQKSGFLVFCSLMLFYACENDKKAAVDELNEAEIQIAEVKEEYAPDSRIALFDIEATEAGNGYILKGESNLPDAIASLKASLKAQNISFIDSVQLLPSEELEGRTKGIIKISVANLRSEPSHSSELVTQASLGTPVNVLKKEGTWFYVQTPDDYLAWTDYGAVSPISEEDFKEWHTADKLIYLNAFGFSYENPDQEAQVVSDLVAGNILELLGEEKGFYKVQYPDGRKGFIEKLEAQPYREWISSLDQTGEALVQTAKSLMGLPYLWGGTSPKGVDCSGYTKTIYFLNGMVLPRDASQQIRTGIVVDSTKNFKNLLAGDLLYFGREATDSTEEKIVHVGMWIGDNKFIHAMGDVHISTFDTSSVDFDQYNYDRYLRSKRLLGQEDERIIQLAQSELFVDKPEAVEAE